MPLERHSTSRRHFSTAKQPDAESDKVSDLEQLSRISAAKWPAKTHRGAYAAHERTVSDPRKLRRIDAPPKLRRIMARGQRALQHCTDACEDRRRPLRGPDTRRVSKLERARGGAGVLAPPPRVRTSRANARIEGAGKRVRALNRPWQDFRPLSDRPVLSGRCAPLMSRARLP
jgi:hypothetical protein